MGWLDNYGKEENPNDSKIKGSSPGLGISTKGRNYSPAWGGQFQNGGWLDSLQERGDVDMYGSPITAKSKYDDSVNRTNYEPRTNQMIFGNDFDKLTPEEQLKTVAHENRHAWQFGNDRTNFDIVHNPDTAFQSRLQKKPQMMTTNEVYENYHNRKQREVEADLEGFKQNNPQFSFVPDQLLYKKFIDNAQYHNPNSVEGEAEYYQNTGEQFQNGGSTGGSNPGSVGFSYARIGAPSNGKKAKKTLASAKHGNIINDDMGQWAHPGEITRINSNNITMKGVPYDVLGISDTGDRKLMKPGEDYDFDGSKVTEYPMSKDGSQLVKLDQLTNFTNYNDKQPGGWLDQYADGGPIKGKIIDERAQGTVTKDVIGARKPLMKEVKKEAAPKATIKTEGHAPVVAESTATKKVLPPNKQDVVKQLHHIEVEKTQQLKKNKEEYASRSNDLDVDKSKIPDVVAPQSLKTENDVKKVQQNLQRLGYDLNPTGKFKNNGVDGKLGKVTLAAIEDHNRKGEGASTRYTSYKQGEGLLGKCTEKQCSEYTQNELFRNLKPSVSRPVWNEKTGLHGDAWHIGKNIEKAGGKEVPINQVKQGNVVTVYTGVQTFMKQAKAAGTDATHLGIVDKVNPDGSYYIVHNVHAGNKKEGFHGREYRTLVKADGSLSGNNMDTYKVRKAYEPNYSGIEGFEKKVKTRDDVKLTFNPKYEKKLQESNKSVGKLVSDTVSKVGLDVPVDKQVMHQQINKYLTSINDTRSKQVLANKHNLSETDYQSLAQVAMGILGQETSFGSTAKAKPKEVGAALAKAVGYKKDEVSKGAARLKYQTNYGTGNLSELGVTEDNFTDDDKTPLVVMDLLASNYKNGVNSGLSKEEALYRAVEKYNKGHYTEKAKNKNSNYVNSVMSFAEGFNPKDKNNVTYNTLVNKLNLDENLVRNRKVHNID